LAVHALNRGGVDTSEYPAAFVKSALDTCKGKLKLLSELPAYAGVYFKDELTFDPEGVKREFTAENKPRLQKLRNALAASEQFNHETIGATLAATAKELGVKTGVLVHPTRLACSGTTAGPSLYHLMAIQGKELVLRRLDTAIARIE